MSDGTLKQEYSNLAAKVGDRLLGLKNAQGAMQALDQEIQADLRRMTELLVEINAAPTDTSSSDFFAEPAAEQAVNASENSV